MSRSNTQNKSTFGLIGVALAGLVLSGSAFAMQPLSQGYMLGASHAAGEGKCGEGKCGAAEGTAKKTTAKSAEGKCGEGKCGATEGTTAAKKTAEGKCGEGQCGDEKFAQVDTDNDALVSRAEFLAVAPGQQALFAQKDVNRDGYISEKESYDSVKSAYETHGKKLPSGLFANPPRK